MSAALYLAAFAASVLVGYLVADCLRTTRRESTNASPESSATYRTQRG